MEYDVDNESIKVAFPYDKPASFYDPLKIFLSPEYTFLENTFSPLVEYTPSGELVSSIAEKFVWVNNEAHFKIRPNCKTVDGVLIDAKDVELTFKRMFILKGNTHGDLKELLCPNVELKSLSDPCLNLEIRDHDTLLVMKFKERKNFLFPMLAALDFSIIPKRSINAENLEIIDYRNTTGPYFVEEDKGGGYIHLAANSNHFHFSKKMPQKILLVPSGMNNSLESLELFKQGKVDLITTVDHLPSDFMIEYSVDNNLNSSLHKTYPLRSYIVSFTPKGRKKFTIEERFKVGNEIKKIFFEKISGRLGYEASDQLFSIFGEAALSNEKMEQLKIETSFNTYSTGTMDNDIFEKKFSAWIVRLNFFSADNPRIKQTFPNGKFLNVNKAPGFLDFSKENIEEPDLIVVGPDMGFLEDIGLLTHYMYSNIFYLSKKDGERWLNNYMKLEDKLERIELLKDLHFKTLKEGVVIPIAISPYTAIVRKPWKFNFSKIQASDALWRIFRE